MRRSWVSSRGFGAMGLRHKWCKLFVGSKKTLLRLVLLLIPTGLWGFSSWAAQIPIPIQPSMPIARHQGHPLSFSTKSDPPLGFLPEQKLPGPPPTPTSFFWFSPDFSRNSVNVFCFFLSLLLSPHYTLNPNYSALCAFEIVFFTSHSCMFNREASRLNSFETQSINQSFMPDIACF